MDGAGQSDAEPAELVPDDQQRQTPGARLRYNRKRARLTQKAAAGAVGISERAWRDWETDKTRPADHDVDAIDKLWCEAEDFPDYTPGSTRADFGYPPRDSPGDVPPKPPIEVPDFV